MQQIEIIRTQNPKPKPQDETKLGFGNYYTDHMFTMEYKKGEGWHNPRIVPFGNISLSPAAMCLHYGQEVFEGLKAYRTADDDILLFRPEKNMERLNLSNDRLCIPEIDEAFVLHAIKELISIDQDWVPHAQDTSLYIRPFIFATNPCIGVMPAEELMLMVILSPVGAYYPEGLAPVKIYVEDKYVRAVPGGMGYAKTGGNYAVSLKAQAEVEDDGYSQVLWLDGHEHKYVEEVGSMNIFFVFEDEIVTPALQGSILGGITRLSVIELLKSWGMNMVERAISIDEIIDGAKSGRLKEVFGSGTAAVISSVGELAYKREKLAIGTGDTGELTHRLYDALTGIQWGRLEDEHSWTQSIK